MGVDKIRTIERILGKSYSYKQKKGYAKRKVKQRIFTEDLQKKIYSSKYYFAQK